jgi:HAE1 family hydrophobic/amphiphilic exporter-1
MIAGLLLSIALFARAEVPAPAPMTVSTAYERALVQNPRVREARERRTELEAQVSSARAQLFPSIAAVGTANYRKDSLFSAAPLFGGEPYNFYSFGFQLNQPLYDGGATFAGISAAGTARELGTTELSIEERDLAVHVIESFYGLLLAQRRLELLKRNTEVTAELLKTAENRKRIGRSQQLEVLQIRTQAALLVPKVTQAENQVQIAAFELASLLGQRNAAEVRVRGALEPLEPGQITRLTAELRGRVLEVQRAQAQLALEDSRNRIDLARHYPQLGVVGTWGRTAFAKNELLNGDGTAWSLGLQLTLPLFSGLSSIHERRAHASELARLEIESARIADQAALDQVKTGRDLETAEAMVASSREAVRLAELSLREATRNYRLSTADYREFLTSQQNLFEAEQALDQARHDHIVAVAKYFAAWGQDPSRLIAVLDKENAK